MRLASCLPGKNARRRRRQMEAYDRRTGNALAVGLVAAKIRNQAGVLRDYGRSRKNGLLRRRAREICSIAGEVEGLPWGERSVRSCLMGYEGEASRIYFDSLKEILPMYAGKRTRRPPGDVFNACLSYGYGVLFSVVQKGVILSGLDPDLGFLHADGNPSLVLDLMEVFRQPVVDRVVLNLCTRKLVGEGDVTWEGGGCLLNQRLKGGGGGFVPAFKGWSGGENILGD